ncbi:MAG TPA: bi-domain-containing oxidoreductase [Terriglobales bacterium]|jgi:predicted dehydrogenase/threonine dehydrogenase-like Zn-dependent dehydrogenase|nr:bi-domain-containing oxidoreductase [Terriglobales bacterium]
MKQVLQGAKTGEIEVAEVPEPTLLPGCVLVRVAASLVSAGTERASAEFASKNLFQKAKARPDLVREVIGKVRRDGIASAVSAVRSRLDIPSALGYSSAGTVIAVAPDIADINVGDRVACAGAGYAVHAEFACVPRLLVARITSDSTTFEEAAFTTVGAVALHGIRTAEVNLGDTVAVIGLGLLGQLTVQLLKAAGCNVLGMDILAGRTELAMQLGADGSSASAPDFARLCSERTHGSGVDAVLIAAETPSSDPVNLAGEIARDRGVVVAVGTVGMNIKRKLYYEKELDFRISRSYGPGRYDSAYEQEGRDYPIGYVRWTETRNMEAFVRLLAEGKLDLRSLISHRFSIHQAQSAYRLISGESATPSLAVVITYDETAERIQKLELVHRESSVPSSKGKSVNVGLLGTGNFAIATLLPAMKAEGINLIGVCAANGSHSRHAGEKFGFRYCATSGDQIINDTNINTVVIATRHNLHAPQIMSSIGAGKNVFCEKPLCLTEEELAGIVRTCLRLRQKPLLMVGFNRRFAPMAVRLKTFVDGIGGPLAIHYRVNAGYIPRDHWVNNPGIGGGRIIGEVCHFIDFLVFLTGAAPVEVLTRSLPNSGEYSNDNVVISLQFANGSQGTISYLANGDRAYSKERVEVFGGKSAAVLEDFRRMELVRHGKKQVVRSRFRQDKGHRAEWKAFVHALLAGSESPIPFEEIVTNTLVTFAAVSSQSTGKAVSVDTKEFIAASVSSDDRSLRSEL